MLDQVYPRLVLELVKNKHLDGIDVNIANGLYEADRLNEFIYSELLKLVYKKNTDSSIGLHFGQYLSPSALCDLSRLIVTSKNIVIAFDLLKKYHRQLGTCFFPVISNEKGVFSIALIYPYKSHVSATQRRFCAESTFSYLVNSIRSMGQKNTLDLSATFDYPKPEYFNDYRSTFGEKVFFEQGVSVLRVNVNHLEESISTSDPIMHQVYLSKCLENELQFSGETEFRKLVTSTMLMHYPESLHGEYAAELMGMSLRVLQRRLRQDGLTFLNLVNNIRCELAKMYLVVENKGVEETSKKLGFASKSGFLRFFKCQFGGTPGEYMSRYNNS